MSEVVVEVKSVKAEQTKNGKTIWKLTDGNGKVYSTFKADLGNSAIGFEGGPAKIEYKEEQKGEFLNRYLNSISAAPAPAKGTPEYQPEEVDWDGKELRGHRRAAWAIAVSAMQHTGQSGETPKRAYERIKPFQQAILNDIYADFGGDLPTAQDADLYPGLNGDDEDIPF